VSRRERSGTELLRLSAAGGVAAAVIVAVLVNILAARHYRRWDWTAVGLYSLSPVTEQTLSGLTDRVEIYVLLSDSDPLTLTLRHLLEAYRAVSGKLDVTFIDPDRSPAELIAVQQRFGIVAGRSEAGQVVTDAAVIVARGERHHFLTGDDLIEVELGEEARARPQIERALTGAVREVSAGKPPKVCFTSGHGELSIEVGGNEGLLAVRSRLEKLNHEVEELAPLRDLAGRDSIGGCRLVIVAGPSQPLAADEVKRLLSHVEGGGSALVFAGPEPEGDADRFVDVGLGPLLALAGVKSRRDFVFERDPSRRAGVAQGEMFMAAPLPHPITAAFVQEGAAFPIVLAVSSSLERIEAAAVEPTPLLVTSDDAFGMSARSFFAWARTRPEPEASEDDARGPLTLAYAAELPARGADQEGPRLVIVGSNGALWGANWLNESTHGTALLVESAVSWLVSEPILLDIPDKRARPVGLAITEEALASAFWKLVVFLPLAPVLLGLGIHYRRRATEGRKKPGSSAAKSEDEAAQSEDEDG
jgi:hypothetical protein